jgi:hypothetical protein
MIAGHQRLNAVKLFELAKTLRKMMGMPYVSRKQKNIGWVCQYMVNHGMVCIHATSNSPVQIRSQSYFETRLAHHGPLGVNNYSVF